MQIIPFMHQKLFQTGSNYKRQFTGTHRYDLHSSKFTHSTNNCLILESEVVIPYQIDTAHRQVFGLTGIPAIYCNRVPTSHRFPLQRRAVLNDGFRS
jgi:hypothetical protein